MNWKPSSHWLFSVLVLVAFLSPGVIRLGANARADEKAPKMKEWEQSVRKRLDKDEKLKPLAAKYPLALLHSRRLYVKDGSYKQSAFSFIYETSDEEKHRNDVQLLWGNGESPNDFHANMVTNQRNLVADLGKVDFEKNPDLGGINIDDPRLVINGVAVEGHVYLERVRDTGGNNFYVLFQVVEIGPDSRYVAFIWRKLPGGKIVKENQD